MDVLDDEFGEHGLKEACERLAAADYPAYVKDGELRYLAASPSFAATLGKSPDRLVAAIDPKPDSDGAKARDEAERRCIVFGKDQRVCLTGINGERHVLALSRLKRADGTFALLAVDPAMDIKGLFVDRNSAVDPAHFQSAAIRASTRRGTITADLQSVIEAMPVGIVVTDAQHTVELVNGPFFDIWKVAREDLVGHHFRKLMDINRHNGIYPVDDGQWEDYIAFRIGEIEKGPIAPREFKRADGVVLKYSVTPIAGGRRMICYVDITDIEVQKRAAEEARAAIERSSRMLDEAAEAMAQGLLIYDPETILFLNERFYEFVDVPRDRIKPGAPWLDLIEYCAERGDYGPPEEARKAVDYIRESAGNGVFHQMERRGGDGRWLRIDGKPTATGMTVVTYSDITELKAQEADLKTLVVKAEDSDRAKSEFLANMSHEIRTPMNGVLGMAELLSKTDLDTRQKTYCDIVVKSGNALLTIINDILDFSKIEAGEVKLTAATFDLSDAINDVSSLMATGAAEKDIELAVRLAPDLPRNVVGDAGRFRQTLTNLVGNAVKFTEKGHVLVALDGVANDGTLELTLKVEDTGLGIPASKLTHIFDKFSQVDGSSTRRHEGTGLGLAITSRLVSLMGGTIDVESAEGAGSVFIVKLSLPVAEGAPPVVANEADIAGARVLVIDDNAVNRDILLNQMESWGCDACAAVNGPEGLAVIKAAQAMGLSIDCVVLDHHMPGMTGLEMAALVRADAHIAETPIVLLTSVDVDPSAADIVSLKLADWLTKPAHSDQLLAALKRVIGSNAEHRAAGNSDILEINEHPDGPTVSSAVRQESGPPNGIERRRQPRAEPTELPRLPLDSAGLFQPSTKGELDRWIDSDGLAESVAGIGAALSFDRDVEDDAAHRDRHFAHASQSAGRPVKDKTSAARLDILVAEDNEVNQIVFSQILDDLDVVYRIVGNGQLALDTYRSARPRLILMDVSMPVMNGHEATRRIRELEEEGESRVPIIGVTAHALKDDRQACIDAGMDDYMSKPISPDMLERKLREWMELGCDAQSAGARDA